MKKILFYIFCIICLLGCNPAITQEPDPEALQDMDLLRFQIIKYDNPEYAEYVLVYEDTFEQQYSFQWSRIELSTEIGNSPYVYLGNGYYMTNWMWGYGLYSQQPDYPACLINKHWSDVESAYPIWDMSAVEVIARYPASELYAISYKDVDAYLGISQRDMMPKEYQDVRHGVVQCAFEKGDEWGKMSDEEKADYVKACTSIGDFYVEKIQELYANGVLFEIAQNKLANKTKQTNK